MKGGLPSIYLMAAVEFVYHLVAHWGDNDIVGTYETLEDAEAERHRLTDYEDYTNCACDKWGEDRRVCHGCKRISCTECFTALVCQCGERVSEVVHYGIEKSIFHRSSGSTTKPARTSPQKRVTRCIS